MIFSRPSASAALPAPSGFSRVTWMPVTAAFASA
jgi:hypothetical protein